MSIPRAPALFVPHGGGPLPLLGDPSHTGLVKFLKNKAPQYLSPKPRAILLVTAHWEESNPTISSGSKHDLYYDYYGFPPESYKLKYPARGDPSVAKRTFDLLKNAGFSPKLDDRRGWDHGVFVPLMLMVPQADIPVVQMSVLSSQDPEQHIRMGKALAPLRDEGVAIIGSGMTFHNMSILRRLFGSTAKTNIGKDFDDALTDACCSDSQEERERRLLAWEKMPGSRDSQPAGASEHLMPLLVVAGAGGAQKGQKVADLDLMSTRVSGFLWQ